MARQGIGDGDDAVEASSANLMETEEGFQPVFFEPRPLRNLVLIDEMESLSPITDLKVRQTVRSPGLEVPPLGGTMLSCSTTARV